MEKGKEVKREELKVARVVLRFPPFAGHKKEQDGFEVEVRNPLREERPWSLFLLSLWKREEVREYEKVVVVRVPLMRLSAYVGEESGRDIKESLLSLRGLSYFYRDGKRSVVFGVLNSAVVVDGYIELEVPASFWHECNEHYWRILVPFVAFIRGKYELGLFTFLSTDLGRTVSYSEEVLFQKAGMKETIPAYVKRFKLKKALEKLRKLGFIAGFDYSSGNVSVWFPSMETLRALSLDYARRLEEKVEAIKQRKRESVKKSREKKKEKKKDF